MGAKSKNDGWQCNTNGTNKGAKSAKGANDRAKHAKGANDGWAKETNHAKGAKDGGKGYKGCKGWGQRGRQRVGINCFKLHKRCKQFGAIGEKHAKSANDGGKDCKGCK